MSNIQNIQKIRWRHHPSMNTWTGTCNNHKRFVIEGGLCLTDLGEDIEDFVTPKHYRIFGDAQVGKDIASDLLNGLNLEVHQANWQEWEDENLKSIETIQKAEAFLKSLTAKCECETQGDNTCDYCEDQEKKRILAKARKQADEILIQEAAEKANGYRVFAKETKAPIFEEGFIEGVKSQTAKDYWYRKFKGE